MIEIPSTFPVNNRPSYSTGSGYESQDLRCGSPKTSEGNLEAFGKAFSRERTNTHDIMEACSCDNVPAIHPSQLIRMRTGNKRGALEAFVSSKDGVFVSPSCSRGVDLPDDLCRFIIIAKCPFGDLNDKLINKRVNSGGLERSGIVQVLLRTSYKQVDEVYATKLTTASHTS